MAKVVCINKGNFYVENEGVKDTVDLVLCGLLKKSKSFQIKTQNIFTKEHNESIYKKPMTLVALPNKSEATIKFSHGYRAEETTYLVSLKIAVWRKFLLNAHEKHIIAYATYLMRQDFFGFENALQPIKMFINSQKIRGVRGDCIVKKGQSTESCIYFILKGCLSVVNHIERGSNVDLNSKFQK